MLGMFLAGEEFDEFPNLENRHCEDSRSDEQGELDGERVEKAVHHEERDSTCFMRA